MGAEIIQAAEEKVAAEKAETKKKEVADKPADAGEAKPGELSDEELAKGIQIGRVMKRVAGNQRLFRQKVMPDPEDPESGCS